MLHDQVIKILLTICQNIQDQFQGEIDKYSRITYNKYGSQYSVQPDLKFKDTLAKLEINQLPEDYVVLRLLQIAKHHNW